MTLDTHVYVHDEVDPHSLFAECRRLLGAGPEHPWSDDPPGTYRDGRLLRNQAGVGLPALLWLHYQPDAPYQAERQPCDDDCSKPWSWRNEFTGEIHSGEDRYRRLGDLIDGGQAAMRWFKGVVEPAIPAMVAEIQQRHLENAEDS